MAVVYYLFCIIVALILYVVYRLRCRLNYWKDLEIPHDKPSITSGNFQGVMTWRSLGEATTAVYRKHNGTGPFCGFYFFHRPGVLVLDKDLIKHVLIKDFANFVDRGLYYNEKDDPLTGNLFFVDDHKWRSLRKTLSPTFTSGKMKFMFPTVAEVAEHLVEAFNKILENQDVVETKDLMARFSIDVIGSCAFGIDCHSLKDPNAEFFLMGKRAMTEPRQGPIANALMQSFPDIARKLGVRTTPDDIHDFFIRIVKETVAYREKENVQRNDFLNILMDLNKGKIKSEDQNELQGFTINEMAAQVFAFFLGGFETSSATMSFMLYELSVNYKVQNRLREEVTQVLNRHNNAYTYECMQDMKYMDQAIKETLRKHPVVPFLTRQAKNDYTIPDQPKYVIRKGMPIVIPVWGIHSDPNIYPNPEVFDPERFSPEAEKERDPITWLPFGDGPRNCIGLRFAMMQIHIAMAFLIRGFKFSTCPETEMPPKLDTKTFIMNSQNGMYLKVERV